MTSPSPYNPLGVWSGTWQSEDGAAFGTLSLEFYLRSEQKQPSAVQSVHFFATGTGCGSEGDVGEGSFGAEVSKVNFFVMIRNAASTSADASGASFVADVEGDRLVGNYATSAFGNCQYCGCPFGLAGSWVATRSR